MFKVVGLIFSVFLSGCASTEDRVIGYLGFTDNAKWAIQFNDCTVTSFEQARKYIWFDRELSSVSCYTFKENEIETIRNVPIRIYSEPSQLATHKEIMRFSELTVSESGLGTCPSVYQKLSSNWFKVAEGWIYLQPSDLSFVSFYSGPQDFERKKEHDEYYLNH
ncbi:hypothetical protein [Vibrio parahaemolyticus]|uniref:hypothetical protein n=1 Tax=Vibrio parahaemolyticus TaxID=670 RepID=UPI0010D5B7C5|nr:hypothetical protein [Vibrio parahaemolyticus]ELA9326066.1 hypothetical protein [Vibrio parahaemolyticus]ELB2245061.1 hypothetical protein [Vibrio parahaemolyticus]MBM5101222.1 hypothetical protein [Vibrio parahaemolyticus]MBM5105880.1 hypothetical protein [Vibrio parahaemolyticus]MDF5473652.1 hypothetical protein [Vibrio parahaemolyticus]